MFDTKLNPVFVLYFVAFMAVGYIFGEGKGTAIGALVAIGVGGFAELINHVIEKYLKRRRG